VSKARDTERRAKEVAKRILSSNGPRDTPDRLGHTSAIRMASVSCPSPTPLDDEELPISPSTATFVPAPVFPSPISPTLTRSFGKARTNGDGGGVKGDTGGLKKSKTITELGGATRIPPQKLGSKSRAKDDMDIATEADKARVRRLVNRWEEMKYF